MSPQQSESRDLDKVMVRLPDGMRDKLKAVAAESNRSLNAEIVFRLDATLGPDFDHLLLMKQATSGNSSEEELIAAGFTLEPPDPEALAIAARGQDSVLTHAIGGLAEQLREMREENKFLLEEVNALYRQIIELQQRDV